MRFPKDLGYVMLPEFELHEATWLSWPKNRLTFPGEILRDVERIYCELVTLLSSSEKVYLLVDSLDDEVRVSKMLEFAGADMSKIFFYRIKSEDVWTRDYCPTFIVNRSGASLGAVKWVFNAWGSKYSDLLEDDIAGRNVANASGAQVFFSRLVLEGGSLEVNEHKVLMTTEQAVLNENRNPGLSREKLEEELKNYLGVEKVVWLKKGLLGDDTDGHIDNVARFCEGNAIVYSQSRCNDENRIRMEENARILREAFEGEYELLELYLPSIKGDAVLPASYANFYICNKMVLLPIYNDRNDTHAIDVLSSVFNKREIIPLECSSLVSGYGSIHCVTQQVPRVA